MLIAGSAPDGPMVTSTNQGSSYDGFDIENLLQIDPERQIFLNYYFSSMEGVSYKDAIIVSDCLSYVIIKKIKKQLLKQFSKFQEWKSNVLGFFY